MKDLPLIRVLAFPQVASSDLCRGLCPTSDLCRGFCLTTGLASSVFLSVGLEWPTLSTQRRTLKIEGVAARGTATSVCPPFVEPWKLRSRASQMRYGTPTVWKTHRVGKACTAVFWYQSPLQVTGHVTAVPVRQCLFCSRFWQAESGRVVKSPALVRSCLRCLLQLARSWNSRDLFYTHKMVSHVASTM